MIAPEKIRVAYEDLEEGHQGRLSDGRLYIAYATGAAPRGQHRIDRVLAVLQLFDSDGNHLGTEVRVGGYCRDHSTYGADKDRVSQLALTALDELLGGLAPFHPEERPIDVRPFAELIDGVEFGFYFRPVVDDEVKEEWVIHMPRSHWYYPPWDSGEYDT